MQIIKNHFEKHKKFHTGLLVAAIVAGGAYFSWSRFHVHAEGETVPAAPTLTVATAGDESATIEWMAGSDGGSAITSFLIEKSIDGGRSWETAATAMARDNRALVTFLTNGQPYNFHVRAINAIGQSDPSNDSSPVTPAPDSTVGQVSGLTLVPGGDATSLLVSWIDPDPRTYAIDGHRIVWTNAGIEVGSIDADISTRNYTITGLTPGASYIVSVYVRDTEGNMGPEVRGMVTMPSGGGGDVKDGDSGGDKGDPGGGAPGGGGVDTAPMDTSANVSGSVATITWTTRSEVGSYVAYGLDPDRLSYSVFSDTLATTHAATIDVSGIPNCTTLFFKIFNSKEDFDSRIDRGVGMRGVEKVLIGTCRASVVDVSTSPLASTARASVVYGNARTPLSDKTGTYFQVTVPEAYSNRVSTEAVFQLKQLERSEFAASVDTPPGTVLVSDVLDAKAYPDPTETISVFDKPLAVSMSYLPELVDGIPVDHLAIWRSDDGEWTKLSGCSVDQETEVITCETSHFSIFSVFAESPDSGGGEEDPAPEEDQGSASGGCRCVINKKCIRMTDTGPQATCVMPTAEVLRSVWEKSFADMLDHQILKKGSRKHDLVAILQTLLNQAYPMNPLRIDGKFGVQTLESLVRFQFDQGLRIDGIFGPETADKFWEVLQ